MPKPEPQLDLSRTFLRVYARNGQTDMDIRLIPSGPDLRGSRGPGHRPPTTRGPPTKPVILYLSFMLVVYKTDSLAPEELKMF